MILEFRKRSLGSVTLSLYNLPLGVLLEYFDESLEVSELEVLYTDEQGNFNERIFSTSMTLGQLMALIDGEGSDVFSLSFRLPPRIEIDGNPEDEVYANFPAEFDVEPLLAHLLSTRQLSLPATFMRTFCWVVDGEQLAQYDSLEQYVRSGGIA